MAKAQKDLYQPPTHKYEWGGPVGAACLVLLLPLLVLSLNALCNEDQCSVTGATALPSLLRQTLSSGVAQLPRALVLLVSWITAHCLFYLAPIGARVEAPPLRTGERLVYHMNAVHAFIISHALVAGLHFFGYVNLAEVADLFDGLMLGSILLSMLMALVLYLASFRSPTVLTALGGNTPSAIYNFWIGRELNPRLGRMDFKFIMELRPGLIGWSLINWAFVIKSVELGTWTPSIFLVAFFQSCYVFDGLTMEAGNLTMMDIVTDGFGMMLSFGDLAWVPFTYTLQAKYLAYHPVYLHPGLLGLSAALVVLGYSIFRGANTQKDLFRKNPADRRVAHLRVMKTSAGKSLIVSGYWGVCRHPNYVGDWLMTIGWASMTGTAAVLPYFNPIYFCILLMHRQLRDEEHMLEKYGEEDWTRFCKAVPYRLVPGVY